MSSFCLLITFLLYYVALSKEKDIYHVITGESDAPHKRSLDPVYYVGIYDKKPESLPSKYDIELMTADSGKRFTCIIPKEDITKENTANDSTNTQSETISQTETETEPEPETETEIETELFDEEEIIKTEEEVLQEMDTLENRDRYIQELIVHSSNPISAKKKKINKNPKSHCFFSREGYWSYELCLYDKIRQFHGSKHKRQSNLKLGDFTTYIDVSKILMSDEYYPYLYLKDIYGIKLFENTEKNFVHLLYTSGQNNRESLVTIQCSNTYGKRTKDGIIQITEPQMHHYHFVLIYKPVCKYFDWLQKEYGIYDGSADNTLLEHFDTNDMEIDSDSYTSANELLLQKGIDPNSNDISLLLSPLFDSANENKCLLLKQGWWTVEYCYGQFVRQIHLEAKKQKNKKGQIVQSLTEWDIRQEHVVGTWDKKVKKTKDHFVVHKNVNDPRRTYASIIYGNGDECDLTKQPRQTEIQFRCSVNGGIQSELVKSREDPSCYYIAQVETPLLCGHSDFKIPSAPQYEIVCYPFEENEFVQPASLMKAVADIQSETDQILKIVTIAAQEKYEERETEKSDENIVEKDKKDVTDEVNDSKNKQSPKLEL